MGQNGVAKEVFRAGVIGSELELQIHLVSWVEGKTCS